MHTHTAGGTSPFVAAAAASVASASIRTASASRTPEAATATVTAASARPAAARTVTRTRRGVARGSVSGDADSAPTYASQLQSQAVAELSAARSSLGSTATVSGGPLGEQTFSGEAPALPANMTVSRSLGIGTGAKGVTPAGMPTYYDTLLGANELYKGFNGLNLQTEGEFPVDAAVAASTTQLLNAVAGKAAFYNLNAAGNATGPAVATTQLSGFFESVYCGSQPPAATLFEKVFAWPAAIHDKITGRFVLASASTVQTETINDNGKIQRIYPADGVGAVYLAVSGTANPQSTTWQTMGIELESCGTGFYTKPDMLQVGFVCCVWCQLISRVVGVGGWLAMGIELESCGAGLYTKPAAGESACYQQSSRLVGVFGGRRWALSWNHAARGSTDSKARHAAGV